MIRTRTFLVLSAALILLVNWFTSGSVSAQAGDPVRVFQLSASGFEQAHTVAFSPNGKTLAVGGTSGVYLIDPQQLSVTEFIRTGVWVRSLAFMPGTDTLTAGLFDHTIKMWNVPNAELIRTLNDHQDWVRSISFSADGSLLASASDDETIRIWKTADFSPLLILTENTTGVRAIALSPDGTHVAGALGDKTVRVWSVPSGELIYTLSGHEDWVRSLAFSPDGQLLASGAFDKNILLWDMANGTLRQTLKGHSSSVLGVAFSPDGKTLASGSVDGTVRLWNVSDGKPIRVLQGHENFVFAVVFSPDGKTLASSSADNTVRLWDMTILGKPDVGVELPTVTTPSDCRACHHRRGYLEPAPVIELDCENCHAGGIGLSWCGGIPRTDQIEKTPIAYNVVKKFSGVPSNDEDIAVMIASPGNGETLYVRDTFMVPEYISGKIFYSDANSLKNVEVRLDIISGDKITDSLTTHATENGTFTFNVALNFGSTPPYFSRPGTRQCLACHGDYVADAGLPDGDVHVVVTATTPDGQQAVDNRWFHVDSSKSYAMPVHIVDEETKLSLSGLSVDTNAILYQWRSRYGSVRTDTNGDANLKLDVLSQAPTTYAFSVPPQVVNGILYASPEPVDLVFNPDASYPSSLTLSARAVTGQINGEVGGAGLSDSLQGTTVWAIQYPAGPAYQTTLNSDNGFSFDRVPVAQYVIMPDPLELKQRGLSVSPSSVNLLDMPVSNISFSVEGSRYVSGKVAATDGTFLPFAWVNVSDLPSAESVDVATGNYALANFPNDAHFVTFSAPGYYSQPQSVRNTTEQLDVSLVPRPDLRIIPWGDGKVFLPSEGKATVDGLAFNLEYGWVWGNGSSSQPVTVHLSGMDVRIVSGRFAMEQPVGGTGWLYLYEGQAEVLYNGEQAPVQVRGGEMIATVTGAQPFPIESAVVIALHPTLQESPIPEVIEPSLRARVQNWLVKTGIGAMQTITFITYILSLVTLIAVPVLVLFSYRKKRRSSSDSQEK